MLSLFKAKKMPKLGTGKRFASLSSSLARKGKVRDPGAVAAAIGRRKYGAARFSKLSARGRKKKEISLKARAGRFSLPLHPRETKGRFLGKARMKMNRLRKSLRRSTELSSWETLFKHRTPKSHAHPGKSGGGGLRGAVRGLAGRAANRFLEGRGKLFTGRQAISAGRKVVRGVGRVIGGVKRARRAGISRAIGRARGKIRFAGRVGRAAGRAYTTLRRRRSRKESAFTRRTTWKAKELAAQSMIFKDEKGDYRWVLLSSNGYRDRDGEIISTKALERDVAQWELAGKSADPLRWWHVPITDDFKRGLELGQVDFRQVHGHTLIESGTFDTKEIGEAVSAVQDKLAGSIGFHHSPNDPDSDKIFHQVRIFERSLLPRERTSNVLSHLMVTAGG